MQTPKDAPPARRRRNVPPAWKNVIVHWLALCFGCDGVAPRHVAAPMQEQQFSLRAVRFEERRGDAVLWTGEGRTADGEVRACQIDGLTLRRLPQGDDERPMIVRAPFGDLRFADGAATFSTPIVEHSSGAKLYASRGTYDEAARRLRGEGPVALWTPSCVAYASHCVLNLADNVVEIEGPVQGIFNALPAQP